MFTFCPKEIFSKHITNVRNKKILTKNTVFPINPIDTTSFNDRIECTHNMTHKAEADMDSDVLIYAWCIYAG